MLIPEQRTPLDGLSAVVAPADFGSRKPTAPSIPTRKLCRLVYVEEGLRNAVDEHFPANGRRAWAPCYAVDLAALLRHTGRANRLNHVRDLLLAAVTLAAVGSTAALSLGGHRAGAVVAAVGFAGLFAGRPLVSHYRNASGPLLRRLGRYARQHLGTFVVRAVLAVAATSTLVATVLARRDGRLGLDVVIAWSLLTWATVVVTAARSYQWASRVRTAAGDLDTMAPRCSDVVEQRIENISRTNFLVYARKRSRNPLGPFIGAGQPILRTTQSVAVTERLDGASATEEVDLVTLHKELEATAVALEGSAYECQHRLYVDGMTVDLREDQGGSSVVGEPPSAVDPTDVLARVDAPGNHRRGYVCLMRTSHDGDVVVTMFVRATLDNQLLQFEIQVNALPEVVWPRKEDDPPWGPAPGRADQRSRRSRPRVVEVPRNRIRAVWLGVVAGTRAYPSTLSGSFGRLVIAPLRDWAAQRGDSLAISRCDFDCGAETSLREHLALDQPMQHNAAIDMVMQSEQLQIQLVHTVAAYLKRCGIDPGNFEERTVTMITYNQQVTIGQINSGNLTFGANSPISGTPPPPPPAPPPSPPPSTTS